MLVLRPTIRLLPSIQGQTYHGCVKHDILVVGLWSKLLVRLLYYIHLGFGKTLSSHGESNQGSSDPSYLLYSLWFYWTKRSLSDLCSALSCLVGDLKMLDHALDILSQYNTSSPLVSHYDHSSWVLETKSCMCDFWLR